MKYGVCTWIFGDEPLAETAARLSALGYDGVELKGDLELYDPAEIKDVLGDHGLSVLSLTPQDVDLPHPDADERAGAVDYYLRLLDFAADLECPIVCCHGAVGRIRALTTHEQEYVHFVVSVQRIAARAAEMGLHIAMEVLNRYESHLLNTAAQAMNFAADVGAANVGLLLDAYHMNIEEADLRSAILAAQDCLFLFHAADSNRQAVGRGHTDFRGIVHTLKDIGYGGAIILECTASGPDPFTPVKGEGWREEVTRYVDESLQMLRLYERIAVAGD
ncbi:MAG: sugar phosphate isomerase/epimerase family protein [Chloroflexota bacterium]|nr:sugar phosphate isomerase/epimerase family protein [Chloroflexota bacterium]